MRNVSLGDPTFDRLALLARAWNTTPDGAVTRLLDEFQDGGGGSGRTAPLPPPSGPPGADFDTVPVHAVYDGVRVHGRYDAASGAIEIVGGKLDGKRYRTPSGAAIAVVRSLNRKVNPNRNGWSFWVIDSTGERLETLRETLS